MLVRALAPFRRGRLDSARKVRRGRCASLLQEDFLLKFDLERDTLNLVDEACPF